MKTRMEAACGCGRAFQKKGAGSRFCGILANGEEYRTFILHDKLEFGERVSSTTTGESGQ